MSDLLVFRVMLKVLAPNDWLFGSYIFLMFLDTRCVIITHELWNISAWISLSKFVIRSGVNLQAIPQSPLMFIYVLLPGISPVIYRPILPVFFLDFFILPFFARKSFFGRSAPFPVGHPSFLRNLWWISLEIHVRFLLLVVLSPI